MSSGNTTAKTASDDPKAIIIRPWPKVIFLYPTFIVSLVAGVWQTLLAEESSQVYTIGLVFSVVFSVIAGYVTALLARAKTKQHALALGLALLAVGIFAQVQFWDVMPLWYHLSFLALLIPGVLLGEKTQGGRNVKPSIA